MRLFWCMLLQIAAVIDAVWWFMYHIVLIEALMCVYFITFILSLITFVIFGGPPPDREKLDAWHKFVMVPILLSFIFLMFAFCYYFISDKIRIVKNLRNVGLQCRVCHGTGWDNVCRGWVVRPCRCKGTMANVHEDCLFQWRAIASNPNQCEVCGYKFKQIRCWRPYKQWSKIIIQKLLKSGLVFFFCVMVALVGNVRDGDVFFAYVPVAVRSAVIQFLAAAFYYIKYWPFNRTHSSPLHWFKELWNELHTLAPLQYEKE